jgi:phosphomannomutase
VSQGQNAGGAGQRSHGGVSGQRRNQLKAGSGRPAIARVEAHFTGSALSVDRTDGISMSFPDWRFNLRSSNTEPVVRLNVESRGDTALMEARTQDILALLKQ